MRNHPDFEMTNLMISLLNVMSTAPKKFLRDPYVRELMEHGWILTKDYREDAD